MFFPQLVIGTLLICLTVVVHAIVLDRLLVLLERIGPTFFRVFHTLWKVPMMVMAVLGIFIAHIAQIWIWAMFYIAVGALDKFEATSLWEVALYFSTSAFTTVGFGDVYLDEAWRLISSFQAANGFILFGWSTAFIFEVMNKLYERESIRKIG